MDGREEAFYVQPMLARPSAPYPLGGRDRAQHGAVHVEQNCPEAALGKERLRHDALVPLASRVASKAAAARLSPVTDSQQQPSATRPDPGAPAALQSLRRVPIK